MTPASALFSTLSDRIEPERLEDGNWALRRYHHVKAAFHDPRLSSRLDIPIPPSAPSPLEPLRQAKHRLARPFNPYYRYNSNRITRLHGRWFIQSDAPDHTRMRAVVQAPFLARMKLVRPKVQALAHELVAQLHARGTIDLDAAVAYPLSIGIIAHIMGMPDDALVTLKEMDVQLPALMGVGPPLTRETRASTLAVVAYFDQVIADKQRHRTDDLMSDLITAHENGSLDKAELVTACMLMWITGYETIRRLIVHGTRNLIDHREQFLHLKQNPARAPGAVEELLRLATPTRTLRRLTLTEMELGGVTLEKGRRHMLDLYAANHDPAEFHNPHELDILRKPNRHLAFGSGAHVCLGLGLARLEAEVVFRALAQYADRLQYPDSTDPTKIPDDRGVGPFWVRV